MSFRAVIIWAVLAYPLMDGVETQDESGRENGVVLRKSPLIGDR